MSRSYVRLARKRGDLGAFMILALLLFNVATVQAWVQVIPGPVYDSSIHVFPSWWRPMPPSSGTAVIWPARAVSAWQPPIGPVGAPRLRPLLNGAVDHFVVTVPPTATAGQLFHTVIEAQDATSQTVGVTTTVTLATTNGGQISPTVATLISGTGTVSVSLTTAGLARTVRAISGTITGEATIDITAGALTTLTVAPPTSEVTVGTTRVFTATGTDPYGNAVSVAPAWSTNGGTIAPGPAATAVFTAQATVAAGVLVTATQTGVTGTAMVDLVHGPATTFVISPALITTQTAGVDFALSVEAQDAYGNRATRYNGVPTLADATGTIAPTAVTLSGGLWTGVVSITRAAPGVVITATDGVTTGNSNSFTVLPAALDHFSMTGHPAQVIAGQPFTNSVVVTALDRFDNVKTDYGGAVHFTSDDPQAVLLNDAGNPYTFTPVDQGVHAFAGSGFELRTTVTRHITVVDGTVSQVSGDIVVHPAWLDRFALSGYPTTVTAGHSWDTWGATVVVTAFDPFDNVKTDYTGSAYFVSSDPQAVLPYTVGLPYTFVLTDAGSHSFAGSGFEFRTTPAQYLTATNGITAQGSSAITVNPDALAYFVLGDVTDHIAGETFNLGIWAYDQWANLKTDYTGQPALDDATGTITPKQTSPGCFSSGSCLQTGVSITRAMTADVITVTDGLVHSTTNAFDITPAGPDHVRINSVANNGGDVFGYNYEVGAHTMDIYDTYTAWAACYDQYDNYRDDVSATWSGTGVVSSGQFSPNPGSSTTFTPAPILSGTGTLVATPAACGPADSTGVFEIQAPWLTITKVDNRDPVEAGRSLQYTINYANVGNAAAQGVRITETYDGLVSFDFSWPLDPDSGTDNVWTLGTLDVDETGVLNVVVDVNNSITAGTVLSNLVTIGGLRLAPAQAVETTVVTSTPDLNITLTADPKPVNAGDNLVYNIHYVNSGNGPVTGVVITMTYDDHVSYLTSNPSPRGGTDNVWDVGTVAAGSSGDINVTVVVDDYMLDQDVLTSSAVATSDSPGQSFDDDYTTVQAPVLALSKSASPSPAVAFAQLTYTLRYSNTGSTASSALYITDAVPANTDFVSCQPTPCSHNSGIVTWQPGGLGAGVGRVATLVVDVHRNLDAGTVLTNRARVYVFSTPAYSATSVLTTTVVSTPSIWVDISDGQTSVNAGDDLVYTIDYGNVGNGNAYSTVITVTPPLSTYVEGVGCLPPGACTVVGSQLVYQLGTVSGGTSANVRMAATVKDPLPAGASGFSASAVIHTITPGDPLGDNSAQDDDTIATRPDLQVHTDYDAQTPYPGKRITYTVRYSNTGHIATTGVVVSATISEHATYQSAASSSWQTMGSGQYRYTLGAIDYGQSGALVLVVTLPEGTFDPSMHNFDAVFEIFDDGGSGVDANLVNNRALAPLGVPDLIVESVQVNWGALLSGEVGQHVTVTLKNQGTGIACNPIGATPDFCGPFYVDLYINPDPAPPAYGPPFGDASNIAGPIAPGESVQVTLDPFALPSGVGTPLVLYVRVDNFEAPPLGRPYGLVPEYDEDNDVYGPIMQGFDIYLPVILRQ